MVWMMTSGAQKLKDENPNMYAMLLSSSHDPDIVNTIKTDIPRTFPDNIYFGDHSGGKKTDLFNVLIAFACRIPEVGYCQVRYMFVITAITFQFFFKTNF